MHVCVCGCVHASVCLHVSVCVFDDLAWVEVAKVCVCVLMYAQRDSRVSLNTNTEER